jgi:hypothetical protein
VSVREEISGTAIDVGIKDPKIVATGIGILTIDSERVTNASVRVWGLEGTAYASLDADALRRLADAATRAAEDLERRR